MIVRQFCKIILASFLFLPCSIVHGQNPLVIPDTLAGDTFNLDVQQGTKVFFSPNVTPTYGINGNFLGPTMIFNKWDSVWLNVTNNLNVATTMHWHGMHLPAVCDGGPHQVIAPGATWSPVYRVLNDAGTYWYHPHGNMNTELQVTRGLGGMIIVRDSAEAGYTLPRRYGVDDFPLIVQTKSFDVLYQLQAYTVDDTTVMVNGTIDPYLQVPQQVVRLRLLNASADRSFDFGLENDSAFWMIASDGGMLSAPLQLTRITLSPGERAEILVDFSQWNTGQSVYLKSYASEMPNGIMGADSVGTANSQIGGYYNNFLNGADYNIVRFDVVAATSNPVTTIPSSFNPVNPLLASQMDVARTFYFTADTTITGMDGFVDGPFLINGHSFSMDTVNEVVQINDVEIWTLINQTLVAHPFHIHNVQFYVLDINGNPPPPENAGKKDVINVMPGDTVRFITQFKDFADTGTPYMYHCHLLHHEDEGMMGSFIVVDSTQLTVHELEDGMIWEMYPVPADDIVEIRIHGPNSGSQVATVYDVNGKKVMEAFSLHHGLNELNTSDMANGIYFISIIGPAGRYCEKFIVQHY